jgi:hypothetical protein
MSRVLVFVFLNFLTFTLFSQKEDYHWIGGIGSNANGKTNGYTFDFNNKPAKPQYKELALGFIGNNTSISDKEGNLLFYFNGCAVFNKNGEIMPNGDSINAGPFFDKYWKDCKYGYPGPQDVLILPSPIDDNKYFIIHKSAEYHQGQSYIGKQLKMTYVDLNLDINKGDVVFKNKVVFYPENLLLLYLTAIPHVNKKDWWIMQPMENDSIILTFLLDDKGIQPPIFSPQKNILTNIAAVAALQNLALMVINMHYIVIPINYIFMTLIEQQDYYPIIKK